MKLLRILLALMCATFTVLAQTNIPMMTAPSVREVSLEDCIQMAIQHNLGFRIARYSPRLARYTLTISRYAYDPVFNISGQHDYSLSGGGIDPDTNLPIPPASEDQNVFRSGIDGRLPWGGPEYSLFGSIGESYGTVDDNTRGEVGVDLTQPLLKDFWIDSTRLTIFVNRNAVRGADQDLRGAIITLVTQVETAYYNLIAARENVKVQEKALQLADRLLAENKKRVEVGAMAPLDEKQAESQVASSRATLILARRDLATHQNTLRRLLSDNYHSVHEVDFVPTENLTAPEQVFNLQESWRRGMTNRPDLIVKRLALENQRMQARFDLNQVFPALDLFGTYGHSAGGAEREFADGFDSLRRGNQPFYTYGARLTVPLSNKGARQNYRSAKEVLNRTELELNDLEQGVLALIDNDVKIAQASYEQVDAQRAAREYAQAALEAEQKKLENGKSTSFVVLQLQRDLTAAASDEIAALAAYNIALANLAADEASTLERRKIAFQDAVLDPALKEGRD